MVGYTWTDLGKCWGGLKEFYLQEDWELIEKEERPRHQAADPETKSGSEQGKSNFPIQGGAHRAHSPQEPHLISWTWVNLILQMKKQRCAGGLLNLPN